MTECISAQVEATDEVSASVEPDTELACQVEDLEPETIVEVDCP